MTRVVPRVVITLVLATTFGAAAIHSATVGPAVGRTADPTSCFVESESPHLAPLAMTIL